VARDLADRRRLASVAKVAAKAEEGDEEQEGAGSDDDDDSAANAVALIADENSFELLLAHRAVSSALCCGCLCC
jgi:hypothetical protein